MENTKQDQSASESSRLALPSPLFTPPSVVGGSKFRSFEPEACWSTWEQEPIDLTWPSDVGEAGWTDDEEGSDQEPPPKRLCPQCRKTGGVDLVNHLDNIVEELLTTISSLRQQ